MKIESWYLDRPKEGVGYEDPDVELVGWVLVDSYDAHTYLVVRSDRSGALAYPLNELRPDVTRTAAATEVRCGFRYPIRLIAEAEIGFEQRGQVTWVGSLSRQSDNRIELSIKPGTGHVLDEHDNHHLLISGTGRAGTSFLMTLLTRLGLDTGFSENDLALDENSRAGLEIDPRRARAPYLFKSPWLSDYLDEWLGARDVVIDAVIIPMRDLTGAAESRRFTQQLHDTDAPVAGGLWKTADSSRQEDVLTRQLYKLLESCARHQLDVVLLSYPRLVRDPEYLFETLKPYLAGVTFNDFKVCFEATVRPEWVHQFSEGDR